MNKPVGVDAYQVGQVVGAVAARYNRGSTTPPERYDMASLLDLMLSADRLAQSDADRAILRETEGLGTARTRDVIVEGLVTRKILQTRKVGKLFEVSPAPIAEELRDRVPPQMASVVMTAKWEYAFKLVEQGAVEWRTVVDKCYQSVCQMVEHAKANAGGFTKRPEPASPPNSGDKKFAPRPFGKVPQSGAPPTGAGGPFKR